MLQNGRQTITICIVPAGSGGVYFYRIAQPYEYLKQIKSDDVEFNVYISNEKENPNLLAEWGNQADIIIFQSPWSEGILNLAKLCLKRPGGPPKIIIEYDDNLFDVDPFNEKYNVFGQSEVDITYYDQEKIKEIKSQINLNQNNKWIKCKENKDGSCSFSLWKDKESEFDIEQNIKRRNATIELMNLVDAITVTTPELANQLRDFAPQTPIIVLPNMVDPDRWLPIKKHDNDLIRIGWQGGSSHFRDLHLCMPSLINIVNSDPRVRLVFKGVEYNALTREIADKVEWQAWHFDIATYPLDVREMKIDIGLCPIIDSKFNACKSPLKWMEYSMLGIPTVASKIMYSNYIEHNKNGIICSNPNDWETELKLLINDTDKRVRLAEQAKKDVMEKYNIHNGVKMYAQFMYDLFSNKIKKNRIERAQTIPDGTQNGH